MRVGFAAALLPHWRVHAHAALLHRRDRFEVREATIHQVLARSHVRPLLDLLQHRHHLASIRAHVRHRHTDDHSRLRVGRVLHVVRRSEATVAHLHHASFGVGRADSWTVVVERLALLCSVSRALRSRALVRARHLRHLVERCLELPLSLSRSAHLRGLLAVERCARVALELGLERRDLRTRFFELLVELGLRWNFPVPACAQTHAVLCDATKLHEALVHERGEQLRHQRVELVAVHRAEVAERVRVGRHAAADPSVRKVALAQTLEVLGTADALARREEPQRQKHRGVERGTTRRAATRADLLVER
ncbi:MAG: hypothetical protein U0353_01245 [Sandaracinus sp.]